MGTPLQRWLADTAVPVNGQQNDDEARGGNHGVADDDIPVCEVVGGLETVLSLPNHHYFYEVTNGKDKVKQVRNGKGSKKEKSWSFKLPSSHDSQVSGGTNDAKKQKYWTDEPVGNTSEAVILTFCS